MKVFVQDPETYLTALGTDVMCAMTPGARAVLSESHRSRVNWEVFFFESEGARADFDRNVLDHCGLLTDPVTRQRFRPSANSPRTTHAGVRFYFTSDSTAAVFAAMPDSLVHPSHHMRKKRS